jgi:cell division septation protein DedD
MKTVYAFCIIFLLLSAGCSGNKEIKPSEDSLKTKEAMELINTIQTAYQGKNREVLALHIHPVIAKNIVNELSFEKVDLYFTPWIVRIKESSTIINSDWQGTWLYENREIKRRGIADFVFIDSPMKLVHIDGDNPFYLRPVDYEDEKQDVQAEPVESEKAPPAEDEEKIEPSVQPAEDEEKLEPDVRPAEDEDVTEQPVPAPEPAVKGDETSGLQPLKRSKLLYREHDLIPTEQPKALQAEDQNKYIVQVGAWKSSPNAQTALELVREFYPEALIVEEGGFHKIRVKKIMSRHEGMLAIDDLEDKFNFNPVLIGLDVPSTESRPVEQAATDSHEFFVQIGVWRNPEFAKTALADLRVSYPEAVMVRTTNFHKVGIPVTMSREKANALVNEIKVKLNRDAILIEK